MPEQTELTDAGMSIKNKWLQYGALGLCAILVFCLIYLNHKFLSVLQDTNKELVDIVKESTQAKIELRLEIQNLIRENERSKSLNKFYEQKIQELKPKS